jgi:hypothetical protein
VVVLTSHLTLVYTVTLDPVWAGIIPLAIPVPSKEMRLFGLETESGLGLMIGGRTVRIGHGWVSPMFRAC